ncbi:MAG: STAS domain-containing protein [Candidatus Sumerlaeia bacterium]|nr:STAS domain-containing protein [Candidatus Sumerlaeia bacterium]
MEIKHDSTGELDVVRLKGRLDLAGAEVAEEFFAKFRKSVTSGTALVVSFRDLLYISSSGLRVLLAAFKDLQAKGGHMVLCEMNVSVEEVFRFAGLDAVFRIYATEREASESLAAK